MTWGATTMASDTDADDGKTAITFEVRVRQGFCGSLDHIAGAVKQYLAGCGMFESGALDVSSSDDPLLKENVQAINVCWPGSCSDKRAPLLFWQVEPRIQCYQVHCEGPMEDDEGEEGVPAYHEWLLPAQDFEGMWDSLYYDTAIKQHLLHYASSALLFSDMGVSNRVISWNRMVLLHGPPGTGKTSLCKALAQKLSIHFSSRYTRAQMIEINAHSLFSKWFSESGKLVSKLFGSIAELLEEQPPSLVFVLIDEVESLSSARKAAVSGSEPSDAIRAVNALLTQLDGLKRYPNVMVMTTSNITNAIDDAFLDRADIKAYIGLPSEAARYEMLRSALLELLRCGVVAGCAPDELMTWAQVMDATANSNGSAGAALGQLHSSLQSMPPSSRALYYSQGLAHVAATCTGLSGRTLRKLPFLAHAKSEQHLPVPCPAHRYLAALLHAAGLEIKDHAELSAT